MFLETNERLKSFSSLYTYQKSRPNWHNNTADIRVRFYSIKDSCCYHCQRQKCLQGGNQTAYEIGRQHRHDSIVKTNSHSRNSVTAWIANITAVVTRPPARFDGISYRDVRFTRALRRYKNIAIYVNSR